MGNDNTLIVVAVRQIKDFVDSDKRVQEACDAYVGQRFLAVKNRLTVDQRKDLTTSLVGEFFSKVYAKLITDETTNG